MDLEVKKDIDCNKIYARWAQDDFNAFERKLVKARIKKDGYFYTNDQTRIAVLAQYAFSSLANYFVFTDEMRDESDTLIRALETFNAEQFKTFALLIIEPYKDINPVKTT